MLFRFAPMGKVEKTRFERNWTTFVNPAFCPACPKAHSKWWYETDLVEFDPKGVFRFAHRWGKSKKRVLNAIGRRSSTRLFALLGKAHSKWWYETDLVEFDQKGVFSTFAPMGKVEKTRFGIAIGRRSFQPGFSSALIGKAHSKWWYETDLVEFDPNAFFRLSPRWGKSKKRVLNAIGRRSSTRLFALLGKAHSKWWYETDLVEFDPKSVFSFRPDGESRKNAF